MRRISKVVGCDIQTGAAFVLQTDSTGFPAFYLCGAGDNTKRPAARAVSSVPHIFVFDGLREMPIFFGTPN